jgi:trans-2,3-dihydro-3-hydroxyanthranilate isomerase
LNPLNPLTYLHYDVFTREPLLGNQLAVFPDARGLTTDRMQAIAREINFSETTFVFPPERPDTDVRMRIFTPAVEMPMAGHPTVGSTFALAHVGVIESARARFVFGLNVGPTPVDLVWENERLLFAWMTQKPPSFGPPVADRGAVASAIGLGESDLAAGLPIQEVTCGVPYLLVPLREREAVDRATPPSMNLELQGLSRAHPAMLLFARDIRLKPDSTYSRMFAPGLGVVEDPATGSAAGPLGCYLVQHRMVGTAEAAPDGAPNGPVQIVNIQGVKMGRASRIHMAITGAPDAITDVKVGGEAVLVARGEFLATSSPADRVAC